MGRPFEFRSCLEQLAQLRASCLYLEEGQPPTVRVAGLRRPVDMAALTPEDLNRLAARLIEARHLANKPDDGELRFLVKEPGVGRLSVTVRRLSETPSFEFRPAFGMLRDRWGGISDAEYHVWNAHSYLDAFAGEVDAELPPFSRLIGKARALGSALQRMNRPDLARAAAAFEERVRAHANRRSTWNDAKRRETVAAAEQFRALLDRSPEDDEAFARRVLVMCKPEIEAVKRVTAAKPKTPAWKVAEQRWNALVRDFGPPRRLSSLSPTERKRAIAEHRAVRVHTSRDGFGGGSVFFHLMETDEDDTSIRGHSQHFGIVFPAPCSLDAAVVRELSQNAWEPGDIRDLFGG